MKAVNADGTYSFIHPEGDVTVTVTFKGDYKIIKGNNSKWKKGDKGGITVTINGDFTKFQGIRINGKTVDSKHYEAKAGSTVITLKKSYLDTLSAGTYKLKAVYTNGETEGTFVVEKTTGSVPATGDSSNLLLWCAVWILCVMILSALVLVRKKKLFIK